MDFCEECQGKVDAKKERSETVFVMILGAIYIFIGLMAISAASNVFIPFLELSSTNHSPISNQTLVTLYGFTIVFVMAYFSVKVGWYFFGLGSHDWEEIKAKSRQRKQNAEMEMKNLKGRNGGKA